MFTQVSAEFFVLGRQVRGLGELKGLLYHLTNCQQGSTVQANKILFVFVSSVRYTFPMEAWGKVWNR